MLAEAASELFLERGYHRTSVDDIATRAGVSRATFFNYFPTKPDVLFASIDGDLDTIERSISEGMSPLQAIAALAATVTRVDLPLIATQSEAMDVSADVSRVGPARVERLRTMIAPQFPDSLDQWLVTAAIVSATISFATGAKRAPELAPAVTHALSRVSASLKQPRAMMH